MRVKAAKKKSEAKTRDSSVLGVQAGNFRCLDKGAPFIFVRVIVL